VAIITGGGRGIGKGIALKFAEEGCCVAIADVNFTNTKDVYVSESGQETICIECDISDSTQVYRMVEQVISKFGKVDILVNCAGIVETAKPAEDVTEAEWDSVMAVNLKGLFLCCKEVIPHMKAKRYGRIINISSTSAISPASSRIHYIASKAGILGATWDLAFELAAFNICVNAILPGPIRTELWDSQIPPGVDKDIFFENMGKKFVPMKRIGTPEDVAGVALFLASDLSSYVTASQINVGGGLPLINNT
jgi:NAD(P)-dependent dehydrogenase (short-subunit alcohol dehydrogenase family)